MHKKVIPLLAETRDPDEFSLFPNELGGGVIITQDEMLQLSQVYSRLYETYISCLSVRLANQFNIMEPAAKILARRALVPLIHCFMDRLLRIKKAVDCAPGQLTTPLQKQFETTDTIETFEECAVANPRFNQSLIWFIGRVWQLPESDPVPEQLPFTSQVRFKNHIFRLYPKTLWRLIKKIWLHSLKLLPRSRFPTLSMANATGALLEHGFHSRYLETINLEWPLAVPSIDKELREKLFSDNFFENGELESFLIKLKMEDHERNRILLFLKDFMQSYYPPSLLEAIPQNLKLAMRILQPFKKKALISSSGRDTRATYVMACAKQLGLSVIGHQHGGHYGYIEDMSPLLELEYPGLDQFISWGWSRLPSHPASKEISVISLPSPWLSERKNYWGKLNLTIEKEYDFLLMPNMVKRFPSSPHGASTSRIDLINEFASALKHIVRKAAERHIRILHKPYNTTSVYLLAETMRDLELIGGQHYFCEKQLDKGLTHALVRRCHVVLWDQPGTGFVESLSSKIPTMVYWPRTYNQEESWAEPIFLELEHLGIIHRDVDTLLEELKKFKVSPVSWMNNSERMMLVTRFCREFAWTSNEWPDYWRHYLDELSNSVIAD